VAIRVRQLLLQVLIHMRYRGRGRCGGTFAVQYIGDVHVRECAQSFQSGQATESREVPEYLGGNPKIQRSDQAFM
jgi:hypothetical protein